MGRTFRYFLFFALGFFFGYLIGKSTSPTETILLVIGGVFAFIVLSYGIRQL